MDDISKDSRFSHVLKDAKFRKLPKKKVKVKIDKRFQSMFHEKKFQEKCQVDKRGRSVNVGDTDDLKRYYEVSDSESDEEHGENDFNINKKNGVCEIRKKITMKVSEKEKKLITPAIKKKLKDMSIDYARGEGAIFSNSSSEEDDSYDDGSDEFEMDHGWGELDKDAEHTDVATNRLAVCNIDWDRIEATDLMVLFNSFLPSGGIIHSVTIYPSEFGIQRMKEEEEKGPIELVDEIEAEGDEEQSQIQMEKLRKYQLNRLKYYYAVVICNTPETAETLYNECDGLDYECSSSRLDLRFIPEETTFDQEPKQSCTSMPDLSTYKPRYFVTSALTKAKVDLTWDETDVNRQEMVKSIHNGNIDDTSIRKYLACSSSEDENDSENSGTDAKFESKGKLKYIEKYKALLADVETNENKSKKNTVDMEVTWNLELESKTNKVVKEAEKEKDNKTPFQQYLEKRKEKRKQKKLEKQAQCDEDPESNTIFSDDDIPSDIDLNDPYFKEELVTFKPKGTYKKKKQTEEEEDEESKQKKAELELLLLDNEPENKHFSLKKIEESEKSSKKKAKRKAEEFKDDFKIDVNDERFSALYTSHYFNIDPADPRFKATKGVKELIQEKLKRRKVEEDIVGTSQNITHEDSLSNKKQNQDVELLRLVRNIKKNTGEGKRKM